MDQIRLRRLEELLKEEIAALLASGGLHDPRVGPLLSITRVEAARDGSTAKVWVSLLGEDRGELESAVEGLSHAAGFIQAQLSKRVRLRLTPVLRFMADHGIKEGFEMTERIKGIVKE